MAGETGKINTYSIDINIKQKLKYYCYQNNMKTYSDLLTLGTENLLLFRNNNLSNDNNITGIENSLTGKYFDQMVRLNRYIYTTSSTNDPGKLTQAFFVGFQAPLSVCNTIAQNLIQDRYGYSIKQLQIIDNQLFAVPSIFHFVYSNDPVRAMMDIKNFEVDRMKSQSRRRRLTDKSNESLVADIDGYEFPLELIAQYSDVIINEKLCEMLIVDGDINADDLYVVLLNILRRIPQ